MRCYRPQAARQMAYVDVNTAAGQAEATPISGVCEVHDLLDGDRRPRLVLFCSMCQAWICDECRGNWGRRARAALMKRIGR
jgi:hypothetical protein